MLGIRLTADQLVGLVEAVRKIEQSGVSVSRFEYCGHTVYIRSVGSQRDGDYLVVTGITQNSSKSGAGGGALRDKPEVVGRGDVSP